MLMRNWSEKTLFSQLVVMEYNPSELVASNQQNQNQNSGQYDSCNNVNESSKAIEDYCSIWVFSEGETENMISILMLWLMTVII